MLYTLTFFAAATLASLSCVRFACAAAVDHKQGLLELREENAALARLNNKLREIVRRKQAGHWDGEGLDELLDESDVTLLQLASSSSSSRSKEAQSEAPCVEVDDEAGVDQATSNFCLAPSECQERMFACRRHCIEKCWQTDYSKGGAPPGAGDLDQDRLEQINTRVEQKLKEIGVDLGCSPCSGGSSILGKEPNKGSGSGSASASASGSDSNSDSGSDRKDDSSKEPAPKHRFASLRSNDVAFDIASADSEGIVKLSA